jgi:hypothetical protein
LPLSFLSQLLPSPSLSVGVLGDTCIITCSKEGISFKVKGDLGTGSITRKQTTAGEKPEDHTTIEMDEPTELTFALRYLNYFTKVRGGVVKNSSNF